MNPEHNRFSLRRRFGPARALLCALGAFLAARAQAQKSDGEQAPVCALVKTGDSAAVSILEMRLLTNSSLRMVERAQIRKILAENEVSALFEPAGCAGRLNTCRLLNSDMLILVRERSGGTVRSYDIAVAETIYGLRLVSDTVPATGSAEADAATMEMSVARAVERRKAGVSAVVCVPPFLNQDLSSKYDYLQEVSARLLSESLLGCRGVAVVELAEVRAIMNEVMLTGESEGVRRPLPLFLNGEYRTSGKPEAREVSFRLVLQRGTQEVDVAEAKDLAISGSMQALVEKAAGLLSKALKQNVPRMDPGQEISELSARGNVFFRLGNMKEAAPLLEACILVNPDQTNAYQGAIECLCANIAVTRTAPRDVLEQALGDLQRVFVYIQRSLDSRRPYTETENRLLVAFSRKLGAVCEACKERPECRDLLEEAWGLASAKQRVLCKYIDEQARLHALGFAAGQFILNDLEAMLNDLKEPREETLFRMIGICPALRYSWSWAMAILGESKSLDFVERVGREVPAPDVQEAVQMTRRRMLAARHSTLPQALGSALRLLKAAKVEAPPSAPPALFDKIEIVCDPGVPQPAERKLDDLKCVCGPPGVDFFWNDQDIYAMKKKGRMTCIWTGPAEPGASLRHVLYDGRLLWAVWGETPICGNVNLLPSRKVIAMDPDTGKTWCFTPEDGLNPMNRGSAAAVFDEGRLCLAGAFAEPPDVLRSWICAFTLGPDGKKKIVPLLTARDKPPPGTDSMNWQDPAWQSVFSNTNVVFVPFAMYLVREPAKPETRRLMLSKGCGGWDIQTFFGIDPSGPVPVEPIKEFVNNMPLFASGGRLHWNYWTSIMSMGLPDMAMQKSWENSRLPLATAGAMVFADGRAMLIGKYGFQGDICAWVADDVIGPYRMVLRGCPEGTPRASRHYGLLLPGLVRYPSPEELIKRMEAQCDADRGGIESLARQLRDGSVPERRDAADRLCRLGAVAASAVPALMQAVESDDWQTGVAAIEALGAIGLAAEPAVPVLSDVLRKSHLLETQSNARCGAAARSLARMGAAALAELRRIPGAVGDNPTVKGAIRDALDEVDWRASLPGDGRKESLGRPRWIPAAQ